MYQHLACICIATLRQDNIKIRYSLECSHEYLKCYNMTDKTTNQ